MPKQFLLPNHQGTQEVYQQLVRGHQFMFLFSYTDEPIEWSFLTLETAFLLKVQFLECYIMPCFICRFLHLIEESERKEQICAETPGLTCQKLASLINALLSFMFSQALARSLNPFMSWDHHTFNAPPPQEILDGRFLQSHLKCQPRHTLSDLYSHPHPKLYEGRPAACPVSVSANNAAAPPTHHKSLQRLSEVSCVSTASHGLTNKNTLLRLQFIVILTVAPLHITED